MNTALEEANENALMHSSTGSLLDCHESSYMNRHRLTTSDSERDISIAMHMSRTDNLLYSVFPMHIAEALREGRKVEPENHECVTIFFSDIVGFTDISSTLDPLKVSDMLDRLYNRFDKLSDKHDVFKVETIGDSYMAVTNLTKWQPDHCKRIVNFAMDAVVAAAEVLIDEDDPSLGHVNIRVGFHSGPVVSNVVGSRNPRYCLFGDTVNTASRMESNSEANRIHCSEEAAKILQQWHPDVKLDLRGDINVKGKGRMKTYWVVNDRALSQRRSSDSFLQARHSNPKIDGGASRRASMPDMEASCWLEALKEIDSSCAPKEITRPDFGDEKPRSIQTRSHSGDIMEYRITRAAPRSPGETRLYPRPPRTTIYRRGPTHDMEVHRPTEDKKYDRELVEVTPGNFVPLRGSEETMEAINHGRISSLPPSTCRSPRIDSFAPQVVTHPARLHRT